MVIRTKDIFTISGPTSTGRPYLNESQVGALSTSSTFLADKRTLMNWIKRTPEAIGILRQMAMDIVTRINFVALPKESKGTKGGRPPKVDPSQDKEEKAVLFAKNNHLKQQLRAAVIEGIALGDAYLWKGKNTTAQTQDIIQGTFKELGIELKQSELDERAKDEDYLGEKVIQYIASATMNIEIEQDGTRIKSYVQRTALGFGQYTFPSQTLTGTYDGTVLGQTRRWKPVDIIHYKFMDIDGKVHGFTPMQSSFPIIKTLGAIKDYHGHYFESGIVADLIFNFKEGDPNSVHHQKMQEMLQEWWNNKRRAPAVTTGDMSIERLNEWNKDMEFRLLAIYYTGVIAFSVGMPLEKIRAILGSEVKSTTGGSDIGNTDYQRNIYDMQEDWETLLNTQFFNENFGVDMRLERTAARDQAAEAMRDSQIIGVLDKMFTLDWINEENRLDVLAKSFPDIPRSYWNPNPEPPEPMDGQGLIPSSKAMAKSNGKDGANKSKLATGQAQEAFKAAKKKQQEPQQRNKPPTGD